MITYFCQSEGKVTVAMEKHDHYGDIACFNGSLLCSTFCFPFPMINVLHFRTIICASFQDKNFKGAC